METAQIRDIQVKQYSGGYMQIMDDDFYLNDQPAALALVFMSSGPEFLKACEHLKSIAGDTPVLAVSTGGQLCSAGARQSLYCENLPSSGGNIVMQLFSPDVLSDISIHTIPLFSADIQNRNITLSEDQRIHKIKEELQSLSVPFPISAQNTFALTFVDGLSHSEGYLMKAVYESGLFPCLFAGGSSAESQGYSGAPLFDGENVIQNHAIVTFCKMAKGAQFGAFKSQNFRLTDKSFVVIEKNGLCSVKTVISSDTEEFLPITTAMHRMMECAPDQLEEYLYKHSFGSVLDGEVFVNSVGKINHADGSIEFYCDVNPGDELFLLEATDFVEKTLSDIEDFLCDKPNPIGAILNDCLLRRVYNNRELAGLDNAWDFPAAGYSTFGELFGVPVNQTLSAIVFFKNEDDKTLRNRFINQFPIHYARYMNYFSKRKLSQAIILSRIRLRIIQKLLSFTSESNRLNEGLNLLVHEPDIDEEKLLEEKAIYEKQLKMVEDFAKTSTVLSAVERSFKSRDPSLSELKSYRDPSCFFYEIFYSNVVLGLRLRENIINLNRSRHAAKAAEETLKVYANRLESINKELAEFSYVASHDMKEPLRGIHNFSQFLLEDYKDVLDQDGKKKLDTLQKLSKRAMLLIDRLLEYSRIERREATFSETDLNQVLGDVLELMAIDIEQKNGVVEIPRKLPVVVCSPALVEGVFRNLIMNALKYNDNERKIIEVGYTQTHEKMPGKTLFYVKDNGIGIPKEHQETIFKMFKRLHADNVYGEGTGAGLSIVKKIIERHNGTIWVESDGKTGTTFYFTLSGEP